MLQNTDMKEEKEEFKAVLDETSERCLKVASVSSHKCDQCDYIAKHLKGLKMHIDFAHKGIIFMCDQCDYSSRNTSNLNSHKKTKHEKRVFKCLSCDFTSSFKQYLQKHMKEKHDGLVAYFCSECDFNCELKNEYNLHKRTIHAEFKVKKFTKTPTTSKKSDNQSLLIDNSDSTRTEVTSKAKALTLSNGYKTRKPHSTIKPFKCDQCDYSTTRKYNVTIHKQSKHEVQSVDFFCDMCTFSTTKQAYLTRHLEVVHNDTGSKRSYPLFTPSEKLPEHNFFHAPGSHMPHLLIDGHALVMNKFFLNGQGEKSGYFYCVQKNKNKCKVSAKACVVNPAEETDSTKPDLISSSHVDSPHRVNEDVKEEIGQIPLNTKGVKTEMEESSLDVKNILINNVKTDILAVNTSNSCSEANIISKEDENDISKLSLISYQGTHTEMCSEVSQQEVVYKDKPKSRVKGVKRVKGKSQGEKDELFCDLCDYKANLMSTFKKHHQVKHQNILYSCDQCDYHVKYEASLKRHKEAVHEGKTYDCTLCEFKASTASHLKIHVESIHEGITHDCEYCGKKFKQKIHLKTHVDGMHKGITYSCTYCSYISRQKAHLSHHISTKHEGNPHKCDICGIIYAHNGQLKFHKVKEHGDVSFKKNFKCTECEFSSHKEIFLSRHIQRRHEHVEGKKRRKRTNKKKSYESLTSHFKEKQQQIKVEENIFVEIVETKPTIVELEAKFSDDLRRSVMSI